MRGIAARRLAGWIIVIAGIGVAALATVGDWLRLGQPFLSPDYRPAPTVADALPHLSSGGLLALAGAGLLSLLFSRAIPRWWSLAYAALALGLFAAIMAWQADIAAEFVKHLQVDPDHALSTVPPRRSAHYLVLGCRLVLGVVATLAIAGPLLLPPRLVRSRPDVPQQPLGLQS